MNEIKTKSRMKKKVVVTPMKKSKTPVRKKTSHPVFNETFSIQLPKSYLSDVYTVISVCSKNKLGNLGIYWLC